MQKNFNPKFGLQNKHIQTIYASLFRKSIDLPFKKEIFHLKDGDILDIRYLMQKEKNVPFVLLFHGLAGSYKSPYIQGCAHQLYQNGFSCAVVHFRGATPTPNKQPRSYHSGDTNDAKEVIEAIVKKFQPPKIFAVGYSLGANMLLKLLGELSSANTPLIDGAVATSAPLKLDLCANHINKGFSKFYQYILLKDLKKALHKKYETFPMHHYLSLKKEEINTLNTFWKFDDAYTAPIHGFKDAHDYYRQSSAFNFLKKITTPTLIIHAKDDPFMPPEILPTRNDISSHITLEILTHGGHVGFVGGTLFKPHYWLEERIVAYFKTLC